MHCRQAPFLNARRGYGIPDEVRCFPRLLPCRWCSARAEAPDFTLGEIRCGHGPLGAQACRAHSWLSYCSIFPAGGRLMGGSPAQTFCSGKEEQWSSSWRCWVVLASFLLVGPLNRVGHDGVHADLPGHRYRGRSGGGTRRGGDERRGIAPLQTGIENRCPVGTKGGLRPPFAFCRLRGRGHAPWIRSSRSRGGTGRPSGSPTLSAVYRRPLGNDPGTLDPPRISVPMAARWRSRSSTGWSV